LPAIAGGGETKTRYRVILNAIRGYDLVALQEVFWRRGYAVAHLPEGYAAVYRSSARPLLSPRLLGNGLALIAPKGHLVHNEVQQHRFSTCAGWVTGATDCPARKGLLRVPYGLANGDTADIYTLHLDAGERRADARARAQQLEELGARLARWSAGRAVIVLGDFNIDRGDSAATRALTHFFADHGLQDTGALRTLACRERLDYIAFRSGGRTHLTIRETGIDALAMGSPPVSDHPPTYAVFAY
jgi:endonuclease/exonuclease/phosphatase family metal-dependent hydrolase